MMALTQHPKSVSALMRIDEDRPAEEWLEIELLARPTTIFRELPDLTLAALSGISLPPHQRSMIYQLHLGTPEAVIVASRGTSKSSTVLVLYAAYVGLFYSRRTLVTLSATGFRGGQLIFQDTDRWMRGGWDSQRPTPPFFRASMPRDGLNRSQNYWSYEYDNFSRNMTFPTKDPDAIRGIRANMLLVDEANTADEELIDKVATPFLNVKGDFEHGGRYATANRIVYTTTIDYNWRPFIKRQQAAQAAVERDYRLVRARARGDTETVKKLESPQAFQTVYVQYDYTDLLIRRELTTRDGARYRVHWPNPKISLDTDPSGIPFTELDDKGFIQKDGRPTKYFQTYPVDKESLERGLLNGTMDQGGWLSEQRNVVDAATGDVYPHNVLDQVVCAGDRAILRYKDLPSAWQHEHAKDAADYVAPVLWKCNDPCVLGVDYAPTSDFCAFVVIRLGPLATGPFNPLTHTGQTEWSNVIWAEQHRKMTGKEAADRVRALLQRYNIVYFHEPHLQDTWAMARGIGLDMRGGGSSVRDELAYISENTVDSGKTRIVDPLDKDDRIVRFMAQTGTKPMLDAIAPSDGLNDLLVEFTLGQMQQRRLFIAKYLDRSDRPKGRAELHIGYEAMKALDHQLRKLRQKPTKTARHFYMEGDTSLDTNKKDLWAAFIYASKQARAHIIRHRQASNVAPPMGGVVTYIGPRRNNGKAYGARG